MSMRLIKGGSYADPVRILRFKRNKLPSRYENYDLGVRIVSNNLKENIPINILRGGSWNYNGRNVRSASRDHLSPYNCYDFIGFRLLKRE